MYVWGLTRKVSLLYNLCVRVHTETRKPREDRASSSPPQSEQRRLLHHRAGP